MIGFKDPMGLGQQRPYKRWYGWLFAFVVAAAIVMWGIDKVQHGFGPERITGFACLDAGGRWNGTACNCFTNSACPHGYVCGDVVDGEGTCVGPDSLNTDVTPVSYGNIAAESSTIPTQINLDVPFTSQAPKGNWDLPYQEACEETSILMTIRYFEDISGVIDADTADHDIVALTDYVAAQGMGESLTAEQAITIIEGYFPGYDAEVVADPTVDQLKTYLAQGIPVIVPSAGRELGNPFFSGIGPAFHMIVLRGYTDETFITNDPGTRHGENYTYPQSTILEAISDYNTIGPDVGAKNVIIIHPAL